MKNILFAIAFLFSAFGFSQTNAVYNMARPSGTAITTQTVTNTTPDTAYIATQYAYESVTIQALAVRVSGTLTATERVEGSVDGTNYVALGDTATLTAATTHSYHWIIDGNPYKYYRVIIKASLTNSSTFRAFLMPNGRGAVANVYRLKSSYSALSDTITNTATGYLQIQIQNHYESMTIQAVATNLSGTQGGTITLQGSNDGTNYNTVSTVYLKSNPVTPFSTGAAATATATDVDLESFVWTLRGSPYEYYRLSWAGTGTMSSTLKGYLLTNK